MFHHYSLRDVIQNMVDMEEIWKYGTFLPEQGNIRDFNTASWWHEHYERIQRDIPGLFLCEILFIIHLHRRRHSHVSRYGIC